MPSSGLKKFIRESDNVLYTGNSLTTISTVDVDQITEIARKSDRRRARICTHRNKTDSLHNMMIALCNDTYVRPHKHIKKPETFHVVKGRMKIVIFEDYGRVKDVIKLGNYLSKTGFFYRLDGDEYHTVIPLSEFVVFHESTTGPFRRENTLYAEWSPEESDKVGCKHFMNWISDSTIGDIPIYRDEEK